MKKLIPENIFFETNQVRIALGFNQSIAEIRISTANELPSSEIKYAQNNITSDLISIDCVPVIEENELVYRLKSPICASHIFVLGERLEKLDIAIFQSDSFSFDCYPQCFDFELKENYLLDGISVLTDGEGLLDFDVYTSIDGRDFDFVGKSISHSVGEQCKITLAGKEGRIVRVYLKYCTVHDGCKSVDITVCGDKSGTPVKMRPKINTVDFKDSKYNVEITKDDTVAEVYGIIERIVGKKYKEWFALELCDATSKYDFYEISDCNGKIKIKGNSGVSLASGINFYLKYFCKVNISQVGSRVSMPEAPVIIKKPIHRETKAKIRYAYNYCTLSYTMAFWGECEWQRELDFLALNGVNLILDTTAQEEVWRRFLKDIGYSHEDIKNFLVGPAYYAWAYMANTTKIGGPLHDSWFEARTELARKNHLYMRKLGMIPILQGFSGMMPLDIKKYDSEIDIIDQGLWCASVRPPVIRTTSPCYKKYAERFYKAQRSVYGAYSNYFAADPFHEGGKVADMKLSEISAVILNEMCRERADAVWVLQSWQENPASEFLSGVSNNKEHILILDLYAEKNPNYTDGRPNNPSHGYDKEFDNNSWIFCMLNNFGGRLGMHGHLDNLINNIPLAFNNAEKISGIGITPEASENNPVLYDFLFECIWQENADEPLPVPDIDSWICEYVLRRYGSKSESAVKAWSLLCDTVYKAECNMLGQGATESIVNARPDFDIKAASTWGNAIIGYDKAKLEKALLYLEADYEQLKASEGYIYDLISLRLQVMSNKAAEYPVRLKKHFEACDVDGFKQTSEELLTLARKMNITAGENRYYTLGRILEMAKKLSENADDFTKFLYPFNAKAQITTWGEYSRSEIGRLHDYSNRIWSGLIDGLYIPRWERWIFARINELRGEPFEQNINWFEMEWKWVTDNN